MISVQRNDKWGFINKQGEIVIPCKFDSVNSFTKELTRVKLKGRWLYINKKGERVPAFD